MWNMRPFQVAVLGIFAVLAIAGLYLFASFKGLDGVNKVGEVNIWGTLPAQAVSPALEEVKRTHQELGKVSYSEHPSETFDTDVADALASGDGPDLIIINQEQLLAEKNKLSVIPFKTIPERTFRDSYVGIYELFLTSGGTYGIPFVVDPLVLYYNRTALSRAGYATPPTSWEEVLGATPTLTLKTGPTVTKSAIALGTYENIENARAILSLLFLQSGTKISESKNGAQTSVLTRASSGSSGATPAQSALTFYTQFADPAKVVYTWNRSNQSARQSFTTGDTALYIGFASEYSYLKSANPNLDFDMTTIPSPQTSAERVDYARAYVFAIPRSAKNATGAYTAASKLAEKDASLQVAQMLGVAPALRYSLSSRTNDVNADVYYPLALISKGWLSPPNEVTDRIFATMVHTVISGSQTVGQALEDANRSLNSALGR